MTVEALIVSGAEKRAELEPPKNDKIKFPPVLARSTADYQSILTHNIFTGSTRGEGDRQYEKAEDVLRFVKLTSTHYNGRRWEATLYDQGKGGAEIKFSLSDYTISKPTFTVFDRFDNAICAGIAIAIDSRRVVFLHNGLLYQLDSGQSIEAALKQPLPYVNFVVGPLGTAGTPKD
jgi:hypothetical protein